MFERFTERARQVVVLSQQAAREHHHNYIGTEHILEGLVREEEGVAARVLESLHKGDLCKQVQEAINRIVGRAEDMPDSTAQIPFTPRGKKVLEMSLREALSLGHNYIGTEHILLGLVRENEGVGARILADLDLDADKIRNEVIRMLKGPGGKTTAPQAQRGRHGRKRVPENRAERLFDAMMVQARVHVTTDTREFSGFIRELGTSPGMVMDLRACVVDDEGGVHHFFVERAEMIDIDGHSFPLAP